MRFCLLFIASLSHGAFYGLEGTDFIFKISRLNSKRKNLSSASSALLIEEAMSSELLKFNGGAH